MVLEGTYHPDIIVVSNKLGTSEKTDVSNKLQYVPLFYPILKTSIDMKEDRQMFQMNPESVKC
jgi:hypothetical protein